MIKHLMMVVTICFLAQGCMEIEPAANDVGQLTIQSDGEKDDSSYEMALARAGFCCNTLWPKYSYNHSEASRLHWCPDDELEEHFTGLECAKAWAMYNKVMNQKLNYLGCGESTPSIIREPDWISSATTGGYPEISWGFVYTHKYVVERKIGNATWVVMDSLENCMTLYNDLGDSSWVDSSVLVSSMSTNHYYRIKSQIYHQYSSPTSSVKYGVPVVVNISGPTSITTLQTGTFTTSVTGGLPGYEYEWWKYQECDDPKAPIDPKAPSCGSWVKLSGTSSSIIVGGVRPSFRLKVVVSDQDDVTDTDTHYVIVTLPY